jgi:hypothetical protein
MQPVLIDRGQFVPECLVEVVDDSWLASHDRAPAMNVAAQSRARLDYSLCREGANTPRLKR